MTLTLVVFFNPYADSYVKGAARRIDFLRQLLDGAGVPSRAILADDYARAPKSKLEHIALKIHMRRLAYFLHAWRLCQQPGTTVISEVILTPTWHKNMVLTVHDLKAYDHLATRGGTLRRLAYSTFTRLAKRIVVVSESVRDDMQRLCKVGAERIHVVPNGISHKRLALAASSVSDVPRYDFIYVSSFARHKRHALLIRAAPLGCRLCLIGRDLGSLPEVRAEAARRSDEVQVDILENVDTDAELFSLLSSARCGVFPSVFEGFGIPLLEYGAAGLYVIASDIPPFKELAAHVDCFVPPDDETALRKAMENALAKDKEPNALAAARVASSQYTENAITTKLLHLLRLARSESKN